MSLVPYRTRQSFFLNGICLFIQAQWLCFGVTYNTPNFFDALVEKIPESLNKRWKRKVLWIFCVRLGWIRGSEHPGFPVILILVVAVVSIQWICCSIIIQTHAAIEVIQIAVLGTK